MLGNLLEAEGFEYVSSEDILDEAQSLFGGTSSDNQVASSSSAAAVNGADAPSAEIDVPIYAVDAVVRRATALQMTVAARRNKGEGE